MTEIKPPDEIVFVRAGEMRFYNNHHSPKDGEPCGHPGPSCPATLRAKREREKGEGE